MVKTCVYAQCKSSSRRPEEGVYFIPFIKPWKDKPRCARWVSACSRDEFTIDSIKKDTHICNKHFKGANGPTDEYPDPIMHPKTPPAVMPTPLQMSVRTYQRKVLDRPTPIPVVKHKINIQPTLSDTSETVLTVQEIYSKVKTPENWTSMLSKKEVLFVKFSERKQIITLIVEETLIPSLNVLDKQLSSDHVLYETIQTQFTSVMQVSDFILNLNYWNVCTGNQESRYISLVQSKNYDYCEYVWPSKSVHSKKCSLLSNSKLCKECALIRIKLRRLFYNAIKPKPRIARPHCNIRFLTKEQRKEQLKNKQKRLVLAEQKLKRLIYG